MEKQEKKSKKEISLDFRALFGWFSGEMNPAPKEKIQKKKIGMFYYAEDKSFSEELIPNKTVSGVVYHVDETGEHGLIVLLRQKRLRWLNWSLCVGVPEGGKGKENTRLILEFAQQKGLSAEAAEYCANYAYDGVKAGEAFLPSIDELKCIYRHRKIINARLALIKGADLFASWFYWSSSEYSASSAWVLYFIIGYVSNCGKYCSNTYVLPVVAF